MKKIKEIWKDIPKYEGLYQASNFGRIKSITRMDSIGRKRIGKILVLCGNPYQHVMLSKNGIVKLIRVHKIIANLFVKNPFNKPQINHRNGIKADNSAKNLEHCTQSENNKHSFKEGLKKPTCLTGEKNPAAKLKINDIKYIRDTFKNQKYSRQELANQFHIHISHLNRIIRNEVWKQ
jgi:hypothetical protein